MAEFLQSDFEVNRGVAAGIERISAYMKVDSGQPVRIRDEQVEEKRHRIQAMRDHIQNQSLMYAKGEGADGTKIITNGIPFPCWQ